MKISGIGFLIMGLCFLHTGSLAQVTQEWAARYNGPGNNFEYAYAIAVDVSGNVYVTGASPGSGTGNDFATIKYNPSGVEQWASRYNGPGNGNDEGRSIAVDDSGNVFVTGNSPGSGTGVDYATIKYNSAGVEQWVSRYNGEINAADFSRSIAVDNSGNVYVTGYSEGGQTGTDIATIKYSPAGDSSWVRRYDRSTGASNADEAYSLAIDDLGNVYVTGRSSATATGSDYVTIKYSSAGVQEWYAVYAGPAGTAYDEARSIAIDGSGNVYVTGRSQNASDYDYVTVKYNSSGVQQWATRYNGPGNLGDIAYSVAVDDSRNVYVTGESGGSGTSVDYATIKYDSAGVEQWVSRYGGLVTTSADQASSLAVDGSGNVYVTGSSGSGTSVDYAVIKYNTSGVQQWAQRYNGSGNGIDEASSIVMGASGNVYVTGWSRGSGTSYDYVTIKYSQLPVPAAQSTAVPLPGTGSTTLFGPTLLTFISDVTVSDSVTVFYYLDSPDPGTLPSGIIRIGDFYWRVLNGGTVFTNGYMRIATQDIFGVTVGGCGACLVWLKRDNPGDPWQNIGGLLNGTLENGTLTSATPFNSFSEFAIGSSDTTTLGIREDAIPFVPFLTQNYPNPFNPSTKLEFRMAKPALVSLKVYDILGREIATLVDDIREAGSHVVQFQGTGLASGVYFYQLRSLGRVETRQMILLK